jgi:hypothetical protein
MPGGGQEPRSRASVADVGVVRCDRSQTMSSSGVAAPRSRRALHASMRPNLTALLTGFISYKLTRRPQTDQGCAGAGGASAALDVAAGAAGESGGASPARRASTSPHSRWTPWSFQQALPPSVRIIASISVLRAASETATSADAGAAGAAAGGLGRHCGLSYGLGRGFLPAMASRCWRCNSGELHYLPGSLRNISANLSALGDLALDLVGNGGAVRLRRRPPTARSGPHWLNGAY